MKILLFGVSNVGKTTIGKILANKLGYDFFDIDEEIRKTFNVTNEGFVRKFPQYKRDSLRAQKVAELMGSHENCVIAVTPIAHFQFFYGLIDEDDALPIELYDDKNNIFNRLIFTDENDAVLDDSKEYREKHKEYYLREIEEDLDYYHRNYSVFNNLFDIKGMNPEDAVSTIIKSYKLISF